ncbi:hypothetical protein NDU88_009163 [Pleurodeles waltl]|uniref:Uncharacterized protein n=1 Tax=Pleurodeles waltl TaxID=8319 RepID=A0AAV7PRN2_PLEWA|nr:hypothetical protein NDU88_009163 [Pleurodeles waltl]
MDVCVCTQCSKEADDSWATFHVDFKSSASVLLNKLRCFEPTRPWEKEPLRCMRALAISIHNMCSNRACTPASLDSCLALTGWP